MKTISVKAVKRADFGKKAAKAIRREGMVPCVLCGNGETETFSVDPREIKPLIYTPNSYIVEFDIEGKKEQAVLREAQFHPVREEILHLDFFRIADGKPVSIAIPVRLTGGASADQQHPLSGSRPDAVDSNSTLPIGISLGVNHFHHQQLVVREPLMAYGTNNLSCNDCQFHTRLRGIFQVKPPPTLRRR